MEVPLQSRFILQTPRLLIRTYLPTDASALAKLANNPRVGHNLRDRFPSPYTLKDAQDFISKHLTIHPSCCGAVCLRPAVFLRPSAASSNDEEPWTDYELTHGRFIGAIGLSPMSDCEYQTLELGYWFGEPFWGKGYASECVPAYARWAFDEFPHVRRLEAGAFSGNPASLRVLMKAGFVLEGTRREAIVKKDGRVMDSYILGLLRREMDERLNVHESVKAAVKLEGYVWKEAREEGIEADRVENVEKVKVDIEVLADEERQ